MDIRDFYSQLLELVSPWTVKSVVANEGSERVDIHLECAEIARLSCPQCERHCPVCGCTPSRTWRHLDTCRKTTILHARLPIVNCPVHGKQHLRIPWAKADSSATLEFEKWIRRLAEGFGNSKKAAHFAGVEQVQMRRVLRGAVEEAGKVRDRPVGGHEIVSQTPPGLQPLQISLFAQNDMTFVNQGIQAFRNLELEKAVDLFRKHGSLYPKGYEISSRLKAAEFLLQGMREAPAEPGERAGHLCRLWDSFEDYVESEGMDGDGFAARAKGTYFVHVLGEVERVGLAEPAILSEDIPLGYVLLQAGRYDEAVRSLQDCIAKMPHNAALYGWLGDAYRLRGDPVVARQCYREACLIDPAAIDWRHIEDADLKQLKQDILLEYGFDPELALEWLPSHARIEGLFERKAVRLHDGLKEMVDDYLAVEKAWSKKKSPRLAAKLFLKGMVLCENRENLRFIKKIDLIEVRRAMKQANPDLFAEFLERIAEAKGSG